MKESLATEHSSELLRDSLEELLDGSGVSNESCGHFESSWWDITDSCLDIVGDPFYEVAAVFVLYVQHLLIYFLKNKGKMVS